MLHISVCDDNPLHLKETVSIIEHAPLSDAPIIHTYTNPDALMLAVEDRTVVPDIAVLDIELGETDGVTLAGELNRLVPNCQIIFLSGYAAHASDVYYTRHVWFVLKDRASEFLIPALLKAASNLASQPAGETLSFRSGGASVNIRCSEIIYIERVARRLHIVTRTADYLSSQLPSTLRLSNSDWLLRCHQGYWVNLKHIGALDHSEFIMDNGARVPISRTYRDSARTRFFDMYRL